MGIAADPAGSIYSRDWKFGLYLHDADGARSSRNCAEVSPDLGTLRPRSRRQPTTGLPRVGAPDHDFVRVYQLCCRRNPEPIPIWPWRPGKVGVMYLLNRDSLGGTTAVPIMFSVSAIAMLVRRVYFRGGRRWPVYRAAQRRDGLAAKHVIHCHTDPGPRRSSSPALMKRPGRRILHLGQFEWHHGLYPDSFWAVSRPSRSAPQGSPSMPRSFDDPVREMTQLYSGGGRTWPITTPMRYRPPGRQRTRLCGEL